MTHIFGYTIADFSYDSGISEDIKLDYFVMANLTKEMYSKQQAAIFYLCVMNNNVMQNFLSAFAKYEYKGEVELKFINPDVSDFKKYMHIVQDKVADYGDKFVIPTAETPEKKAKMLKFARAVGKRCLSRMIKIQHPKIKSIPEKYLQPPGLDWSFYGTISS